MRFLGPVSKYLPLPERKKNLEILGLVSTKECHDIDQCLGQSDLNMQMLLISIEDSKVYHY